MSATPATRRAATGRMAAASGRIHSPLVALSPDNTIGHGERRQLPPLQLGLLAMTRASITATSAFSPEEDAHYVWRNGAMAFAVTLQILFIGNTKTLGVLGLIATLSCVAVLAWRPLVAHLLGRPLPHVFWVLALLSTLWSIEPALTARFAVQLALTTCIGMLLTGFGNGRGAIQGAALALPLFLIASIGAGHSVAMGASGGTAFAGLTGSKNLMAGSATLGFLVCAAAAHDSFERSLRMLGLLFGASALLALYVVALARSSGAILGLFIISPLMFVLLLLRRADPSFRSLLLLSALVTMTVVVIFIQPITSFITEFTLQTFNKDPTLTGRVYLWQRADDIIKQNPWLGVGYNAFWVQGHIDAEGLWRWAGISGRMGFNFHNTMRETLVAFGFIGAFILSTGIVFALLLYGRLFILGATVSQCMWFCIMLSQLMSIGWESFLPMPFSLSAVLAFGALCASCSPAMARKSFATLKAGHYSRRTSIKRTRSHS